MLGGLRPPRPPDLFKKGSFAGGAPPPQTPRFFRPLLGGLCGGQIFIQGPFFSGPVFLTKFCLKAYKNLSNVWKRCLAVTHPKVPCRDAPKDALRGRSQRCLAVLPAKGALRCHRQNVPCVATSKGCLAVSQAEGASWCLVLAGGKCSEEQTRKRHKYRVNAIFMSFSFSSKNENES